MPCKYTPELGAQILAKIESGITLAQIIRDGLAADPDFPSYRQVKDWAAGKVESVPKEFVNDFQAARECGEEVILDSNKEIADDGRNDWMERRNDKGDVVGVQFNQESFQRSKLRIWTNFELLKKWNPKKYGDRVAVDQTVNVGPSVAEILRQRIEKLPQL